MELSVGSVSLSTLTNETLTSRTALVHTSRATSVSRVSASGRRHFPSSERSSFVHCRRGHLSSKNFPEDILGLGCRLCIKGQKKLSNLHNTRWNASTSGEFTGTSFEATASGARDNVKNEDPVVYFIKEGDTLTAIAKRYNTTISRLAVDNGIDNVDILLPGKKLVIHFPPRTQQIPLRAKSGISDATDNMLAYAPAKFVKELNTATTSGYDTAPTYSQVGGFSPIPSGIMVQVIIPLLLIAPVVGFCVRCAVDYIQERIQKEIEAKHAELESYRSRRRPKVNRWQGILDEDRMETLGREGATGAGSTALDDYRLNDEQQIPTGYTSIRAMNEDSIANESEEENKHRHMKDYEDIRKSYAELETTYQKFLLDSGLSRSGYWRGSVTQLQEEH